jgi:hypothetical protein
MRWTGISVGIGAILVVSMFIAGALGFGVAIQHRVIAPPELDLRVGGFRLLAVVASPAHSQADAAPGTCAPQWGGCCALGQEFYLLWVLAGSEARDSGRPISARVLMLPLQCT